MDNNDISVEKSRDQITESANTQDVLETNNTSKFIIVLLGLILLLLTGAIIWLVFENNQLQKQINLLTSSNANTRQEVIPVNPTTYLIDDVSPTPELEKESFNKLLVDVSEEFAFGESYPSEIINLDEDNLVGFFCTEKYIRQYDGRYAYYVNNNATEDVFLDDSDLISLIDNINNSFKSDLGAEKAVSAISKCITEENHTIIAYEIHGGGGGGTNTAYFGILEKDNDISQVTTIPNAQDYGGPYFSCNQAVAFTQEEILYYECGSGDAGYGSKVLFAINLNEGSFITTYNCKSVSNEPGETLKITCE